MSPHPVSVMSTSCHHIHLSQLRDSRGSFSISSTPDLIVPAVPFPFPLQDPAQGATLFSCHATAGPLVWTVSPSFLVFPHLDSFEGYWVRCFVECASV